MCSVTYDTHKKKREEQKKADLGPRLEQRNKTIFLFTISVVKHVRSCNIVHLQHHEMDSNGQEDVWCMCMYWKGKNK